jgi:hypothetical protein
MLYHRVRLHRQSQASDLILPFHSLHGTIHHYLLHHWTGTDFVFLGCISKAGAMSRSSAPGRNSDDAKLLGLGPVHESLHASDHEIIYVKSTVCIFNFLQLSYICDVCTRGVSESVGTPRTLRKVF